MRPWILRNTIIPLWARYEKSPYLKVARRLERERGMPLEERRARQLSELRALLDHAAANSPYHQERFRAAGFEPGDLRSLDDLRRLPLTPKSDVRERGATMISRVHDRSRLVRRSTSGSTGMPLEMFLDRHCVERRRGILLSRDSWAHWRPGEPRAVLRGRPPVLKTWRDRLRSAAVTRTLHLDMLQMDEAKMEAFARRVLRERPVMLFGHAHWQYLFARFWEERGLPSYRFRSSLCTAMPLLPSERVVLQRVFGCEVFDRYGAEELSLIATECAAHEGLHTNTDSLFIEIMPDAGAASGGAPAGSGRIVVTDLWNYGMPLIRYDLGDRVVAKPGVCACGRTYPLLQSVSGRIGDELWRADGVRLSGLSVTEHFSALCNDVKQIQLEQNRIGHVTIRVVPDAALDVIHAHVATIVAKAFGPGMEFTLEPVAEIAPEHSGKYRFAICNVPHPPESSRRAAPHSA